MFQKFAPERQFFRERVRAKPKCFKNSPRKDNVSERGPRAKPKCFKNSPRKDSVSERGPRAKPKCFKNSPRKDSVSEREPAQNLNVSKNGRLPTAFTRFLSFPRGLQLVSAFPPGLAEGGGRLRETVRGGLKSSMVSGGPPRTEGGSARRPGAD